MQHLQPDYGFKVQPDHGQAIRPVESESSVGGCREDESSVAGCNEVSAHTQLKQIHVSFLKMFVVASFTCGFMCCKLYVLYMLSSCFGIALLRIMTASMTTLVVFVGTRA